MTAQSINPANGELLAEYPRHTDTEVEQAAYRAQSAYHEWSSITFNERAKIVKAVAENLKKNKKSYGELMTKEMGKLHTAAIKEIEKCAWVLEHYADQAEDYLKDEVIKTEYSKSYVTYNSQGVILAVMPWNFPFYQVIRFAAPALMAGNTVLLKHASNVQGCAFKIQEIFESCGLPAGTFTNLNISGDQVEDLINNKVVTAVTLTGSEPAGKAVAAAAASQVKKSVLELGGSDPYIVLADADMKLAIDLTVNGRIQNNGQTCIAVKRIIVVQDIYNEFLERYIKKMESITLGDPMDAKTDLGPMAREDLRDELHNQVKKSIDQGADLKCGGKVPDKKGAWYPATVLSDVRPGMVAFDEEMFGPVAAIVRAADEEHAIQLANNTDFGLGAAVITQDVKRGEKIAARRLQAGNVAVNKLVASDPRLPFGGIKKSGYGREISHHGIKEFVNIKSVTVA